MHAFNHEAQDGDYEALIAETQANVALMKTQTAEDINACAAKPLFSNWVPEKCRLLQKSCVVVLAAKFLFPCRHNIRHVAYAKSKLADGFLRCHEGRRLIAPLLATVPAQKAKTSSSTNDSNT